MLRNYLVTILRNLTRHRLYSAINIVGLALGIAVFLMLSLVVRFETSFERWIPGADRVWAMSTQDSFDGWRPATVGVALDELRADYPQLVGTRLRSPEGAVRQGGTVTADKVTEADPTFFQVFDLPLFAGDKTKALRKPDEAVLSQTKARTYFGSADPVGRNLTLDFDGQVSTYRVVAVLKDPPATTDHEFGIIVPLRPHAPAQDPAWRMWGAKEVATFLRFDTPAEAEAFKAQLDGFVDRHAGPRFPKPAHKRIHLGLTPSLSLHLIVPPAGAIVAAVGVVGLLTLLLAAVNYVNLATAQAASRAREVAVRKVAGATAGALVAQFILEALATVTIAAVLGVALCELALPIFNTAVGVTLKLDYLGDPAVALTILAVILGVGMSAGLYPALLMARFQPAAVLASARSPGGGRMGGRLREALVTLQFAIAIAFTIGAGVIVSQALYVHHADLGFRREGLILVDSYPRPGVTQAQRAELLAAWRGTPGIVSVAEADSQPGDTDSGAGHLKQPGAAGDGVLVQVVTAGPGFFTTYGARLLAGRLPDPSHGGDIVPPSVPGQPPDADTTVNILLNASALQPLGFRDAADAIGKRLVQPGRPHRPGHLGPSVLIVGVVSDIRFASPRTQVVPEFYVSVAEPAPADTGTIATVRYAEADPRIAIERLRQAWRRIAPEQPFEAKTVSAELEPYYRTDDEVARLLGVAAALAVLIGCIGLYGLASFTAAKRGREIGIRKTLGASSIAILRLLVGQILRPVLLANLAAWPLAWLALRTYLDGFSQRIPLQSGYFLSATMLALAIALATIVGHALAVARTEPGKALRED
jgi:putative ABC transport system permease protein